MPVVMVTVDRATDVDGDGVNDVMIGDSFTINCTLNCPTAAMLTWRQNDTDISNSPSTSVTIDGFTVTYQTNSDGEITESVLTKDVAELSDSATYRCAATIQNAQSNNAVIAVYGKWSSFIW